MDGFDGGGFWNEMTLAPLALAGRLCFAALLGGVIGFERELKDRAAGLRTHMLVAISAAAFTIITIELYAGVQADTGANADPIRIIEAVTAGVAFLAAGAIMRRDGGVSGLTTGAGMWTAGAIGVAVGSGFLTLALMLTVIAFLVLTAIHWLEKRVS